MPSGRTDSLRHAVALRLALWYLVVFVASASALSVFTYILLARALASQDHDVLESMLSRYAAEVQRGGLVGLRQLIAADEGEGRHERLLVRVLDRRTEVVYFSEPPGWGGFDLSLLDAPIARDSAWTRIPHPPDGSELEVGTRRLGGGVTIQVGRSSHVRDELLSNFRARAFEVMLLTTLIGAAGGLVLTYVGLAPLRALENTVRSILTTGRFDARVATTGARDPLDDLGRLVNDMLSRIQTLLSGMRGALDNVAHDLRTPLTRFRNVAEAALVADDPATMREGLAQALEEADRVNATLTALMDISEAETGTMRLALGSVRLAGAVDEAVALHADEAEDKGVAVHVEVNPGLHVRADATRLRQVFANLVENAVKYTPAGGRVDVEAATDGSVVTTTVRDTGIGIPAADLPLIWDRLYRGDASRSARGLGLGLSLVKAIVEAHGGTVSASSAPGAGSRFSVTLPAAR